MNDASARSWKLERDAEGIAWLTLDKPGTSANVLSAGVLTELDEVLGALEQDRPRGAVLLSAKKSGFVAGADIKEFTGVRDEASGYQLIHRGQQVLNRLAAVPFPTVAAIHGFALGGGLELALACRYRVAVGDERLSLGLPEVLLGIHPGFGGTVRAVQVAGVRTAMEMMLTGKPLRAEKARAAGLIDRLVAESELRNAARELVLQPPAPHRAALTERLLSTRSSRRWQSAPRARTTLLPTPSSTCGRATVRMAAPPSRPRRVPSRTCSPPRPHAISCASSCCRMRSRAPAARAALTSGTCTSSALA